MKQFGQLLLDLSFNHKKHLLSQSDQYNSNGNIYQVICVINSNWTDVAEVARWTPAVFKPIPEENIVKVGIHQSGSPTRRLPYTTDSYFHILIFVFVSWVGGGDPPWVPAKSLSLHGGQKIQARTAFFSKLVLCVYLKGVNAKKMAEKGEKHIEKRHFLTVQ